MSLLTAAATCTIIVCSYYSCNAALLTDCTTTTTSFATGHGSQVIVAGSLLEKGRAGVDGGGVYMDDGATLQVAATTAAFNVAERGGALALGMAAQLSVQPHPSGAAAALTLHSNVALAGAGIFSEETNLVAAGVDDVVSAAIACGLDNAVAGTGFRAHRLTRWATGPAWPPLCVRWPGRRPRLAYPLAMGRPPPAWRPAMGPTNSSPGLEVVFLSR